MSKQTDESLRRSVEELKRKFRLAGKPVAVVREDELLALMNLAVLGLSSSKKRRSGMK